MAVPIKNIKQYELIKPIGKGGMGEVYLAQDTALDRKVAIKFLPEEMQDDFTARERFVQEAKSAAALDHPFICKIYEAGEIDGKAYIVMEYVEGESLNTKMKADTLSVRDSLNIALEIAEALEIAHKNKIVHRDLKPANIMLTPQGRVKVMDFGLAKKILPDGEDDLAKTISHASLTEQGMIAGTLSYMSPEQARAEDVDHRSDIFALGIVLQEMLAGAHPFTKPTAIETLSSILRDPPPHPNIKPKIMNPILTPILEKTLAKNPADRYQDIGDLANDIRKAQKQIIGGPHLPKKLIPIIAGGVVVVIIAIFLLLKFVRPPATTTTDAGPQPISVIIADVQNQTGDTVFDGVLEKALSLSLDGASFISVYDNKQASQLASQLKPGSEGKVDLEVAQLISRRQGINAVISASIESSDNGYLVRVEATDPSTSDQIAEANQNIQNKADILKAVDVLTAKLRADLGVIPEDSTEALIKETFTTTSLDAMKAYTNAQALEAAGDTDEAIKEYLKALDNDPNLGRAYSGLAVIYLNRLEYPKAEEYFLEAMKRIDQMTNREKFRTRGGYYLMKRNYNKAIEEYGALSQEFPLDSSGHANLALAYFYAYKMPKAFEEGKLALELIPENIHMQFNLAWFAAGAGEFEEAGKLVRPIIANRPDFLDAYIILGLVELAQGRTQEAIQTYSELESEGAYGATLAASGLGDLALYEGRLKDAQQILKKGIDTDIANDSKFRAADKHLILAQIHLLQGNKDPAIAAADHALDTYKNEEITFTAAQVYIQAGEVNKARALSGELSPKVLTIHQAYSKLIGGELSLARDDIPGAITLFQEAQGLVDTWLGHFALGRAYLKAEQFTEAYSEFETCLNRRGEVTSIFLNDLPSYRHFPQIHYYLGRAQEGLRSPKATESYQEFLRIKEKSDAVPGDPMVEDAKKRLNNS
jgi:serine/threonine protein kinase/Tfp pilus assembly protein PilF